MSTFWFSSSSLAHKPFLIVLWAFTLLFLSYTLFLHLSFLFLLRLFLSYTLFLPLSFFFHWRLFLSYSHTFFRGVIISLTTPLFFFLSLTLYPSFLFVFSEKECLCFYSSPSLSKSLFLSCSPVFLICSLNPRHFPFVHSMKWFPSLALLSCPDVWPVQSVEFF